MQYLGASSMDYLDHNVNLHLDDLDNPVFRACCDLLPFFTLFESPIFLSTLSTDVLSDLAEPVDAATFSRLSGDLARLQSGNGRLLKNAAQITREQPESHGLRVWVITGLVSLPFEFAADMESGKPLGLDPFYSIGRTSREPLIPLEPDQGPVSLVEPARGALPGPDWR
jgi:hypothetical protein